MPGREAGLPGWDSFAMYLESVEEEFFLLMYVVGVVGVEHCVHVGLGHSLVGKNKTSVKTYTSDQKFKITFGYICS